MTGAKRIRQFAGKGFTFDSEYRKKTKAQKRAAKLRRRGHNARVIKVTKIGVVSGRSRVFHRVYYDAGARKR